MKTTYYNAQFSPNIFSKNGINSSYFYTKTWDQLSIKKEQNHYNTHFITIVFSKKHENKSSYFFS